MVDYGLVPTHGFNQTPEEKALFYKKIFDDFPALIWLSGTDAKCWYFNKMWLSFRGRTQEEEFGDGWTEGVHRDDYDRCLETYMESFNQRSPFSMEYRLMNHAGEYRWILDMGMPFYGIDHSFQGYIGSCYDITEEKQRIEELRIATETAQTALKDRTRLLSYVSHEIRNPLGGILGIIELLSANTYDSDTDELILEMGSAAKVLMGLINNLLMLSKLESESEELEKQAISTAVFTEEVYRTFKRRVESKGLEFIFTVDEPLPPTLWTDEMKLMQILFNLVGNALKFTSTGQVEIRIEGVDSERLALIVADTGCGIHPEKQNHLFEPYHQGDPSIFKKYGGTGLGLSIVKSLVDQLKGEIRVQTAPEKGTRFEVFLPILKQ